MNAECSLSPRWVRWTLALLCVGSLIGFGGEAARRTARDVSAVAVSTVSAASFESVSVSPESIVAAFGAQLATQTLIAGDANPSQPGIQLPTDLGGTTVEVNSRRAGIFFVSSGQVNFVIPPATETGQANVVIRSGDGTISNGTMQVLPVTPAIFTANANGLGVPAATLLRVKTNGQQIFEPVSKFDSTSNRFITRPIDLGPEGERVFLVLFLTGIRRAADTNGDGNFNESVRVLIAGESMTPLFAGAQSDFVGLDQINFEIPRSLQGRGIVNLSVSAPGFSTSNLVDIEISGAPGTPPQIIGFGGATALAGQEFLINGGGFSPTAAENLVRFAGSEAQVMSASTSQLRVLVPFGVQTGAVSVRTPQGEILSNDPVQIRTSISGLVENTARQPMSNVEVKITGTAITVRTNAEGAFVLPDAPVGAQFIEINGGSLSVNPPYPRVTLKITAQSSRDNQFARPIALQQSNGAMGTIGTGAPFAPEAPASEENAQPQPPVSIQIGGFQLDVPGNSTAAFPSGATRGPVTLTPLLNGRTPVNLPFGYYSASVVQITPFNVRIGLGAKLVFPNSESLPAGTKVDLFRFDPVEAIFTREADTGIVTPDGRRIETPASTVKTTHYYFAAAFRQTTTATGRVIEKNGKPVSRALVRCRGQEALTDGAGTFVLRYIPVTANEPISVEVSSIRTPSRIERIQSPTAPAVVNAITKIPDVILPGPTENRPPVILGANRVELDEGKSYDMNLQISDPDAGQTTSVTLGGATFGTLIKGTGDNFLLRISPNFQQSGEHTMTVNAADNAGGTTRLDVAVLVNDVNRAPEAVSQAVTVDQNGSLAIRLNGTDPDGDPLTYKLLTQPTRGALSGSVPTLTYRPNTNYVGPDSFTFRVSDGQVDSETATVSITVRSANRAPILTVPGAQSTTENKSIAFPVSATDPDAGQIVTISASGLPAGASFSPAAGAAAYAFNWTPSFTQAGTYTVSFTATDNGVPPLSATRSVQISVGDVPVLVVPGAQSITQGSTLTFNVSASAAAAGIPLTISGVTLPPGASVSTSTGSFVQFRWVVPIAQPTGVYTATFRALYSGAPNINEQRSVSITVNPYIIGLQAKPPR
ncbi:MAG: Ig-like domain-containing protein [Blastocatellia bacterium]